MDWWVKYFLASRLSSVDTHFLIEPEVCRLSPTNAWLQVCGRTAERMSSEVQNRGITSPTKRTHVLQNFKKNLVGNEIWHNSVDTFIWINIAFFLGFFFLGLQPVILITKCQIKIKMLPFGKIDLTGLPTNLIKLINVCPFIVMSVHFLN